MVSKRKNITSPNRFRVEVYPRSGIYVNVYVHPSMKLLRAATGFHRQNIIAATVADYCHDNHKWKYKKRLGSIHFVRSLVTPGAVAHEAAHAAVFWMLRRKRTKMKSDFYLVLNENDQEKLAEAIAYIQGQFWKRWFHLNPPENSRSRKRSIYMGEDLNNVEVKPVESGTTLVIRPSVVSLISLDVTFTREEKTNDYGVKYYPSKQVLSSLGRVYVHPEKLALHAADYAMAYAGMLWLRRRFPHPRDTQRARLHIVFDDKYNATCADDEILCQVVESLTHGFWFGYNLLFGSKDESHEGDIEIELDE